MKIFMKILVSCTLISVMFSFMSLESTCSELENDIFRIHIRANSDSELDQNLKLIVRDEILDEISPLYNEVTSKEQAIDITRDNLTLIEEVAEKVVTSNGYDYNVKASILSERFDTRYYEDFTMPAGVYDTLLVEIGEGVGQNYFCVMFPTLCVGSATDMSMKENLSEDEYELITDNDYVFKFKVVEYFEKISSYFE